MTEDEQELFGSLDAVSIGLTKGGDGGIVDVYNRFGKKAVSIQANKKNEGAVYVHDFDGEIQNVLGVRN